MSAISTYVTPSFLLKGVDPNKLFESYQVGYYARSFEEALSKKGKIKLTANTAILAPTYGRTNIDPVFCVKDRHNCGVIIATTGHDDLNIFTRTGGKLPEGGRCGKCQDDIVGVAVGYPIAYQETTVLTKRFNKPNPVKGTRNPSRYYAIHNFWVEGRYCTFECALADIRLHLNQPSDYRDTMLRDSERLLKLLHKLTYRDAPPLRPAQEPRLLCEGHGGSLTKQEWSDKRHVYKRTDRVLIIPAKVEYLQQTF